MKLETINAYIETLIGLRCQVDAETQQNINEILTYLYDKKFEIISRNYSK